MIYSLLVLAFFLGFFLRDIRDTINKLYAYFKDRIESPAGVTRPAVRPSTQPQRQSTTGLTRPLSPAEYRTREAEKRNARV